MVKCKRLKRAVCIFMVLSMVLGTVGCTSSDKKVASEIKDMEIETPASYSFDAIGGKDVMPIMGFYGPRPSELSWNGNAVPDYYSDEFFQLVKDCGINVLGPCITRYNSVPQYVDKLLDQSEKFGLGALVWDNRILDNDLSLEEVDSLTNEYSNHPAFIGVYMVDEPAATYYRNAENGTNIDQFGNISKNINDLGYFYYGNLLGMNFKKTYTDSEVETYRKYASEWVELNEPKALYYDRYLYNEGDNGMEYASLHFKNMGIIRSVAEDNNIPFWMYVEAGNHWTSEADPEHFDTDGYYPSQGEFYWLIGTSLAFGAKGILYFPMLQPTFFAFAETEMFDFQRNGLIGAWGNKTRWYYYAKDMNEQIVATDDVLMNAVNKGVIASGEQAYEDMKDCEFLMEGTSWRELVDISGDAMVGCFNYQGKTALYVVNYDTDYAQKLTLKLADTYNLTVIQDAETEHVSCKNLELTMKAGDSALVVVE